MFDKLLRMLGLKKEAGGEPTAPAEPVQESAPPETPTPEQPAA